MWVRRVFDDGVADIIPVTPDVGVASQGTLLLDAAATPLGVPLAVETTSRTHVDAWAFVNRVCTLDIADAVSEVMAAAQEGRPPEGVSVGSPITSDTDNRIGLRQSMRIWYYMFSPGRV